MKKICIILVLLIIGSFICSCGNINDNSNEKKSNNDNSNNISYNQTITTDTPLWIPFSFTENQSIFDEMIKDNPIDKADRLAVSDGTIQGMIDIQYQFADIWMEELEYSIDSLTALLNQEDKLAFEKTQDDWGQYLSNNQKFLNDVFIIDKYGSHPGRMFLVEKAYEYKNEIRYRALYVKYLQFTLEQNGEATVNFKYQE